MGSFPYRNPFGYHQTWRARHFLIYAIMGGKQSFIKVVSLPYPFSLNAVSFMVASGSSLCLLLRQGRQLRLLPRRGRQLRLLLRQGRQLCLLPRQGHQFRLLPR